MLWITRGEGRAKQVLCFSKETRQHHWAGVESAILCRLDTVRLFETRGGAAKAALMNGGSVEEAPELDPEPMFLRRQAE